MIHSRKFHLLALTLFTGGSLVASCAAQDQPKPAAIEQPLPLNATFAPGDEIVVNGRTLTVKDVGDTLVLTLPLTPTATIGDLIAPVAASGTPGQNGTGREPAQTISGSGLRELYPGSGVFVHTNNISQGGPTMWNTGGAERAELRYDLGESYNVSGLYLWNFNEGNYTARGIKDATIEVSDDGQTWRKVGDFSFGRASGSPEERAQVVPFEKPVKGRYFKLNANSRFGSDAFGLAEIRFANADKAYVLPPRGFASKYPRPTYPKLAQGEVLKGTENIVFPAAANIVDVSKAPYGAKGDGVTDDTDAIQRALDDHPSLGAIIYLPNGKYLVSKQLQWGGSRKMDDSNAAKNTVMWGQSRDGTVIQLKDRAPGFVDPRTPRGVIWTGAAPAQRFGNEIHNLTVDTGLRNPGASGLQFIANNQGGVYDVRIQSGDGQGFAALDLGYTDEQGPMLVKNVETLGFDYGVSSSSGVASWTGENISVRLPNKVGFQNGGQPASVRRFRFEGDVPAVRNARGLLTLLDSTLVGTGEAKNVAAVGVAGGAIFLRDLQTSGFKLAVDDGVAGVKAAGPNVKEHRSMKPTVLLTGATQSLDLPVKETPATDWGDPSKWAVPKTNDSAGIQAAIDSGAQTVLLPRNAYNINQTIEVRGAVKQIIGTKAYLLVKAPLSGQEAPVFRINDGASPQVILQGFSTEFVNGPFHVFDHASKRTLVLKQIALNFGAGKSPAHLTYRNSVGRRPGLHRRRGIGTLALQKSERVGAPVQP